MSVLIFPADNEILTRHLEESRIALLEKSWTIATAESCTGGLLGFVFTHLPGSSQVFHGGLVTYSNQSKEDLLKVPQALLENHGAVSEQVAEFMCKAVAKQLRVEVGLSITGVAGPGGGSAAKPVGTVYCGVSTPQVTRVKKMDLKGSRSQIRLIAVSQTIKELMLCLLHVN